MKHRPSFRRVRRRTKSVVRLFDLEHSTPIHRRGADYLSRGLLPRFLSFAITTCKGGVHCE